jgi:hypothetical protein
MSSPECALFIEQLEELALGSLGEPMRTELLGHAADCATCRSRLDQLSWVTEQVLATVPEVEPPPGFEDRVLSHFHTVAAVPNRRSTTARSRWWIAAAVAIVLAVGGFAIGRADDSGSSAPQAVRTGSIHRSDGTLAGAIVLSANPRPHVLVTLDDPRPSTDSVHCVLVTADGQRTEVGTWSYADVEQGAWAVGVDAALLTAQRMDIVDSAGAVVASATLTPSVG